MVLVRALKEIKASFPVGSAEEERRGFFGEGKEEKSQIINELEVKSCPVSCVGINVFC